MLTVNIDTRESERGFRAFQYYRDKTENITPVSKELLYGDFVFTGDGLTVAFEYKTLEDYIASINDNRVFNQALNQSNNYDYHFVIVVGTDKEKSELIREKQRYNGRYITNKQFYGAYASLVNVTSLIQVPNEKTAFMVMGQVADKCCNTRPVLKRFNKSRGSPALRLLANNVHRIGEKTAERICTDLGLVSINDVLGLTVEDLCRVDGVGVKTAEYVLVQLNGEFK